MEDDFPVTIMTTRKFAETMIAEIDPSTPTDLRELPQPYRLE